MWETTVGSWANRLIENASDVVLPLPENSSPEAFPIKASDNSEVIFPDAATNCRLPYSTAAGMSNRSSTAACERQFPVPAGQHRKSASNNSLSHLRQNHASVLN